MKLVSVISQTENYVVKAGDSSIGQIPVVSVSQNIQTTLQEGTIEQVGDKIHNIGDYATQNRLNADYANILKLEIGSIDTDGLNADSYPQRARTVGYLSAPFSIEVNDGFLIKAVHRYSKDANGIIDYVESIGPSTPVSQFNKVADEYLYRIVFKKAVDSDFSNSELSEILNEYVGFNTITNDSIKNYAKKRGVVNVNLITDTPTTYYTLATAVAALSELPLDNFIRGQLITFRKSNELWGYAQFTKMQLDLATFSNVSNWNEYVQSAMQYSIIGGLNKTNGKTNPNNPNLHYLSSPFLYALNGIKVQAQEGSNNAACCFYDEQFNFISALNFGSTGTKNFILGSTGYEIPQNATYFRCSGEIQDYIIGFLIPSADPNFIENWQNANEQDYTQWLIRGFAYSVGSLNVGDTVTIGENGSIECVKIKAVQGDKFRLIGKGAGGPRLWAWVDNAMKLISKADASITFEGVITAPSDGYLLVNNHFTAATQLAYIAKLHRYQDPNNPIYAPSKWMAFGDSITQGWYSYKDATYPNGHGVNNPVKGWVKKMADITGKTVVNKGIGGTGYVCVGTSETDINARQLIDSLSASDFVGVGLITLAYGINDYKKGNITLGTMSDDVTIGGTVVSNMRYVIEKIQTFAPLAKIIVITPFNAQGYYGQRLGDETTNYAIGHTVNGKTLQDYYNAFVEVCQYYGIQYIDGTHTAIVSRKAIPEQLPDGVHPSEDCHTMIAREMSMRLTMY